MCSESFAGVNFRNPVCLCRSRVTLRTCHHEDATLQSIKPRQVCWNLIKNTFPRFLYDECCCFREFFYNLGELIVTSVTYLWKLHFKNNRCLIRDTFGLWRWILQNHWVQISDLLVPVGKILLRPCVICLIAEAFRQLLLITEKWLANLYLCSYFRLAKKWTRRRGNQWSKVGFTAFAACEKRCGAHWLKGKSHGLRITPRVMHSSGFSK